MKIEVDAQEMIHLLWSHGDAIPKPSKVEIANALRRKMSSAQLSLECKKFVRNHYTTLTEEKVDIDGNKLYNKINGYVTVTTKMSKYTDLARG